MPEINIFRIVARELTTRKYSPRIPEPNLVMEDADQVRAYTEAGREIGVMAPVYLHHCSQVCDVIRPGDTVVDLACGPATQLAQIARLNPETHFIGVDLSDEMLHKAEVYVRSQSLANVELRKGDISRLAFFEDGSVDAVMSTLALHHLPEQAMLDRTFREIGRILKRDGGLFLADFGRLKSERSMREMAFQYAERQPDIFTLDYLNSLKAAFSLDDFRRAMAALQTRASLYTTFLVPYMVAVKSPPRRVLDSALHASLKAVLAALPAYHRRDFMSIRRFSRIGGLHSLHAPG